MADSNLPNFLESELNQIEASFIRKLRLFDNLSQVERIQLATELDFFKELDSAGMSKLIGKLESEYVAIIQEIATYKVNGISAITLQDLELLVQTDSESILRSAQSYAMQFKSRLIKGFISGEDTQTIAEGLQNIGLKTNQTISAINTARDQFGAVAVVKLFEDEPETRFKLGHPIDIKTRCSCKSVYTLQPKEGLTKEEIDKGAWHKLAMKCPDYAKAFAQGKQPKYNMVNRGGFGCRGFVEVV